MTSDQSTDRDAILREAKVVEAAVAAAVREALIEHKRAGNPISVWEDNQVKWIAAEDIVIPELPQTER